MKWLLAMMSQGRNISEFFPYVVKNVMAKSVEVKKMVYIYLVHYADFDKRCREIALLSINSFQKDLAGHNQLIRGMALRVMTSIRVPDVIQIQLLAVRKCSTDHSPYVRKCAAIALPKLYAFDPLHLNELEEILAQLLQDTSTMVLGSSIAAFNEICPNNFKLIHPCYRKLCQLLADLDEWTQVPVLEMMTRYARKHFMDPSPGRAAAARQQAKNRSTAASKSQLSAFTAVRRRVMKKAFYSDEEDESDDEIVMLPAESDMKAAEKGSVFTGADADIEGDLDPDHRLLLKSSLPLLKSRNAGVVLGVASLHYYCGSRTTGTTVQLGKALVRILKNNREIQYVVLTSIITMAQEQPAMFTPYLSEFFIKSTDPIFNRLLKLDILAALTTRENAEIILRELQIYVRHSNPSFVCATVRAVGRIADVAPAFSDTCMEGLMHLLNCSPKNEVYGEVVVTLRQILQQNKHSKVSTTIIHKLLKLLLTSEKLKQIPVARASIIWLIGEFHEILRKLAPDILRILAQGFPDEETETKTQIVNFALKLSLRLPDDENVQTMMTYVLEMTRFDPDFDLRDRSRFMTAIMGLAPSSSVDETALELLSRHAESVLLAPKLPPLTLQGPVDLEGLPHFTLGSLSSVVGHYVKGYSPISPWPEKETDSRVREPVHETTPLSVNPKKEVTRVPENAAKTLNSFLSSSDEESENESSGSGSSDEESTSSEEEESGEDEALPVVKQNPPKAAAPVATKSGMRRVGGTIKKSDDSLISNQLNSESKSLLDLPDQPSTRFFEEPTSFSQPPTNSGYDLLADQFDLLQVQPSPSFSSNFFNGTPIQPSSQFPSPPATDETSILAQIMQSFPQQTSADRKPQSSSASNSETKMSPNVTQQEGMISFPKVILRPEIAQGLKISLLFRHHVRAMTLPGGSSVYLELSNSSPDYPIRYDCNHSSFFKCAFVGEFVSIFLEIYVAHQ